MRASVADACRPDSVRYLRNTVFMTVVEGGVFTDEARAELVILSKGKDVVGVVALRARIVLWWNEGRSAREIVSLSEMSEPTVRLWPERYEAEGVDGLFGKPHPGKGPVHGGKVHARILALSRQSPPRKLGVTHWFPGCWPATCGARGSPCP